MVLDQKTWLAGFFFLLNIETVWRGTFLFEVSISQPTTFEHYTEIKFNMVILKRNTIFPNLCLGVPVVHSLITLSRALLFKPISRVLTKQMIDPCRGEFFPSWKPTARAARRSWLNSHQLGMDQYLLIPFLVGWTSIYQLFWCSPGVQGFDTLPIDNSKTSNLPTI